MNKKIDFLTNYHCIEGLKTVINRFSSAANFAGYIEAIVKEAKAKALAFESYDTLNGVVRDLCKLRKFIDQRAITEVYGKLPRLHEFLDSQEGYLENLLDNHSPELRTAKKKNPGVILMDNFIAGLNIGRYWEGGKISDLTLALCLENSVSEFEGVEQFNDLYADKLKVPKIGQDNIPVFGTSKTKDLPGAQFKVENTGVKIKLERNKVFNSVGGKVGEYFVFLNFEKRTKQGKSVLKPSMAGFEIFYTTPKSLEKTNISQFRTEGLVHNAKNSFKNLVELVSKECNNKTPRHEVSKKISKHARYYFEFHPTTEYFVGDDGRYQFKISVAAEGPAYHHTVRVRGEFKLD